MADCETVQKQSDLKDRRMILRWPFLKALLPAIAGVLLATAAFADPRNTVKNTIIREDNPKGLKSALVVPYAFSTDSMGLAAGVGGNAQRIRTGAVAPGGNRLRQFRRDGGPIPRHVG